MYSSLVLSGGGFNGIIFLGVIYNLILKSSLDIKKINSFTGTSIGSIICTLLSIGYSPLEIITESTKIINNYFATSSLPVSTHIDLVNMNIPTIIFNLYSSSNTHIFKIIETLIFNKINIIPTMKTLYELTGKKLTLVSHCLNKSTVYINHETFPNINVMDAIKMSCNIPFIFDKICIDNEYYVDGGISDNFPVKYVYEHMKKEKNNILGICLNCKKDSKINNEIEYMKAVFLDALMNNTFKSLKYCEDNNIRIIKVDTNVINSVAGFISKQSSYELCKMFIDLNLFSSGFNCKNIKEKEE